MPSHISLSHAPFFLKPTAVPILHWLPNVVIFFSVNALNNYAFGFDISVPVHIILRSGGSVTTMLVGFVWGKRYSRYQVLAVAILTIGVILAAMSDAQVKGKTKSGGTSSTASFLTGLSILFVAQVLSAIMGLYTQATYARYGPHWRENLFYSHFLSLPLFIPFLPSLYGQLNQLLASRPLTINLQSIIPLAGNEGFASPPIQTTWFEKLTHPSAILSQNISDKLGSTVSISSWTQIQIPMHFLSLILNALTQYACIRGVNLLGARTSALGVTVVLNIRKLISLFASIWLFGNELPQGVLAGATVVFIGGGIYAWDGGRKKTRPRTEKLGGDTKGNGHVVGEHRANGNEGTNGVLRGEKKEKRS
ncbi:golgi uridine diphosphate-N- acetylglucosamine transporter [Agyrium rufum]|nr:golgi uridine diphosphate-N- acetylglucosamine transporter [Agyrium rufum]